MPTHTATHQTAQITRTSITSDNQDSITELLIAQAVRDAQAGKRVLYVTHLHTTLRTALETAQAQGMTGQAVRAQGHVRLACGQERITYPNGGLLAFTTPTTRGQRGYSLDTLIITEHQDHDTQALLEALIPCLTLAKEPRLYIAHLTEQHT